METERDSRERPPIKSSFVEKEKASKMDCRATKACYHVLILILCVLSACSKKQAIEPPVVSLRSIDPFLRSMMEESRSAILSSPNSAEAWGKYGQALQAAE